MYSVKPLLSRTPTNAKILTKIIRAGLLNPRIEVRPDTNGKDVSYIIGQPLNGPEFILKLDDWLDCQPLKRGDIYMVLKAPNGKEFSILVSLWLAGFRPNFTQADIPA